MRQESNQSNSNWGCGLFAVDLWWLLWHAVWPELFPAETCRNHQQLGMSAACFTVSRWSSRRVAASLLPRGKQRPVYAESPRSVKTRLKLVDPYWTTCIYTDSHRFRVPLQRLSLHLWWLAHTSSLKWVWWMTFKFEGGAVSHSLQGSPGDLPAWTSSGSTSNSFSSKKEQQEQMLSRWLGPGPVDATTHLFHSTKKLMPESTVIFKVFHWKRQTSCAPLLTAGEVSQGPFRPHLSSCHVGHLTVENWGQVVPTSS